MLEAQIGVLGFGGSPTEGSPIYSIRGGSADLQFGVEVVQGIWSRVGWIFNLRTASEYCRALDDYQYMAPCSYSSSTSNRPQLDIGSYLGLYV